MVKVIAFPPVGAVGTMWTPQAPVQRSQGLISGKRYVSRFGRERIMASVRVSALSKNRSGAGFSEMLKRHLDGGVNLVRLESYPINWHLDYLPGAEIRGGQLVEWTSNGADLNWQNAGQPLYWFNGVVLTGVSDGLTLTVSNLPPNKIVARPSDFIKAYTDSIGAFSEAIVETEARSNADGVAVIKLFAPLPAGAYNRVNIGESVSRVLEATDMPMVAQPFAQNWSYEWSFREVFEDETDGFDEVNPWI